MKAHRNNYPESLEGTLPYKQHQKSLGKAAVERNQDTLDLLGELLAAEIETFFHYRRYHSLCTDAKIKNLTEKKLDEELIRADKIASRISALGGTIRQRSLELYDDETGYPGMHPHHSFTDNVILRAVLRQAEQLNEQYKLALIRMNKADTDTRMLLESQLKTQETPKEEILDLDFGYLPTHAC